MMNVVCIRGAAEVRFAANAYDQKEKKRSKGEGGGEA